MKEAIEGIVKAIESGSRFLVTSHINPDGDAIGSVLALSLAIRGMGKEAVAYNVDGVPYQFSFLPMADELVSKLEGDTSFDAVFVMDCAELERVEEGFIEKVSAKLWINIDHHLTNSGFADISLLDRDACSTGYLVYEVIKALPVGITREIAENIYTTIIVDTGSFRYSNATEEAFRAAGEMVALGVSPWHVANMVYENQPRGRVKLLNMVLDTLGVSDGGKVASVVVTREMMEKTGTGADATDGFVNYPRSIEGVEVAVLVRETGDDEYKVSYRSKGNVNVAEVAGSFGGGGHRNAAGCVLKGELSDVRRRAVAAVLDSL